MFRPHYDIYNQSATELNELYFASPSIRIDNTVLHGVIHGRTQDGMYLVRYFKHSHKAYNKPISVLVSTYTMQTWVFFKEKDAMREFVAAMTPNSQPSVRGECSGGKVTTAKPLAKCCGGGHHSARVIPNESDKNAADNPLLADEEPAYEEPFGAPADRKYPDTPKGAARCALALGLAPTFVEATEAIPDADIRGRWLLRPRDPSCDTYVILLKGYQQGPDGSYSVRKKNEYYRF